MKAAEVVLVCCVLGLAGFVGGQAVEARRSTGWVARPSADTVTVPDTVRPAVRRSVRHGAELVVTGPDHVTPGAAGGRDIRELRRRLATGAAGTYIDDLLAARDSAIVRWPDRRSRPLRVFLREVPALVSWHPDYPSAVRDAFDTWARTGIPVPFTFVRDSATADVVVHFADRLDEGVSGRTVWSRNGDFWLLRADIQLAMRHPDGGTFSPPQMRAVALHEVGHLLGLDHSRSPDDIMAARVRVRDLSAADRATVQLVYAVPAGSLTR